MSGGASTEFMKFCVNVGTAFLSSSGFATAVGGAMTNRPEYAIAGLSAGLAFGLVYCVHRMRDAASETLTPEDMTLIVDLAGRSNVTTQDAYNLLLALQDRMGTQLRAKTKLDIAVRKGTDLVIDHQFMRAGFEQARTRESFGIGEGAEPRDIRQRAFKQGKLVHERPGPANPHTVLSFPLILARGGGVIGVATLQVLGRVRARDVRWLEFMMQTLIPLARHIGAPSATPPQPRPLKLGNQDVRGQAA